MARLCYHFQKLEFNLKYFLFILLSLSANADVLSDPTYICGKNLFKYINFEGIPKIKDLQKEENSYSLKKEGLPNFEIPVKIINTEVDQKFFTYYKFLKGKFQTLPILEKKRQVIIHIFRLGKALEDYDQKMFNICKNVFSNLNKACSSQGEKCVQNFMFKNKNKYLPLYKSFSVNKFIKNIPLVKKLDGLVFQAIKDDDVSKFLKAYNKRMKLKQSRNKSTFHYTRSMLTDNAIKIIQKGELVRPRFTGALEFSGGDIKKFLNYHLVNTKEKTMIVFIKKIELKEKTVINSLLKTAKKLDKKELIDFLKTLN